MDSNRNNNSYVDVFLKVLHSKRSYIVIEISLSVILFLIIWIIERMVSLRCKVLTGKFILVSFSITIIMLSVAYIIFYSYYSSRKKVIERFKYLFISISFGIFVIYYYNNLNEILQSVSYDPIWIKKSTLVFFIYLSLFILIESFIFILLSKKINSFKVGPKGVEVGFEQSLVKNLEEISVSISDVLNNSIALIDNISEIIKKDFFNITLSDPISEDTYYEFIKNSSIKIFNNMKITVNLTIEPFYNEIIIDKIFESTDSSVIAVCTK